jgi:hypothetical protein
MANNRRSFLAILPKRAYLAMPAFCERDIELAILPLELRESALILILNAEARRSRQSV